MSVHFHLICIISTNSVGTLSVTAKWTNCLWLHRHK